MRRLGSVERCAFPVGRDPVHYALVACGRVDHAARVHGERPDVLVLRVEESRRGAVAVDLVDFAVRRRPDVEHAVGCHGKRVNLQFGAVEEHRPFAVGAHPIHLALVAGAEVERAVSSGRNRPDKRRRRLVDEVDGRAEHELTAGINRQIVDFALQEIGLRGGLEKLRGRGVQRSSEKRGKQRARRNNPGKVHDGN